MGILVVTDCRQWPFWDYSLRFAPSVPKSYLVFFDFNKSDLTAQATQIVDQAASNAGPAKVTRLTVTGHTDTVGSDAYNMRLSRRRAESVAARLEKDGIPSSEIEIVAKGKRDLLVPTGDRVLFGKNRTQRMAADMSQSRPCTSFLTVISAPRSRPPSRTP
jgi:outer membrane protein OmpA-like peptidoglycan-associated protein